MTGIPSLWTQQQRASPTVHGLGRTAQFYLSLASVRAHAHTHIHKHTQTHKYTKNTQTHIFYGKYSKRKRERKNESNIIKKEENIF
jgi:hypothetical protein